MERMKGDDPSASALARRRSTSMSYIRVVPTQGLEP